MINVAYIGNGKSTNRYHLPFILKLKDRFNVKTIYSPSGRIRWTKIPDVHYTTSLDDIYNDPEIQWLSSQLLVSSIMPQQRTL